MHEALDRAIAANSERAFDFLEALVRAPSLVGFEQAALDTFADEAIRVGLDVVRLPFANGPVSDPRAGVAPALAGIGPDRFQVFAATPGEWPLHLLLNGHMDVVPADSPEAWVSPPFVPLRRQGRLYGRGAADMKSGFAVGLLALAALRDVAPDLFARRRLGFVAVVEEECTGNGTLRSLSHQAIAADEVVVLEPTDLGLLLGGIGVLWAEIAITTRAGHVESGDSLTNAIDLGMRLVDRLRQWSDELARDYPDSTIADTNPYFLNLGQIQAGSWLSTVPSSARIGIRIGFPRIWTADQAETELRRVVAGFAGDARFPVAPVVTLKGFRARGYLLGADTALVRDLSAAHQDAHGIAPRLFSLGSTTDARTYLNDFGIPAICFGAIAHDMHGIDESVELQSIIDAARTLARFIWMRFSDGASK